MEYVELLRGRKTCPFCNTKKDWIIKQNKTATLMLSRGYDAEGHLLVVPKEHVSRFDELSDDEQKDLLELINYAYRSVKKETNELSILYKEGELKKVGKSVEHMHVHIIPNEMVKCLNSVNRKVYTRKQMTIETKKTKLKFNKNKLIG